MSRSPLSAQPPQPSRRANRSRAAASRITAVTSRLTASAGLLDPSVLAVLDRQLRRIEWRDHAQTLAARLQNADLPPDRARQLGRRLALRGAHPNAVRFGLLLLSLAGTDEDREILTDLGLRPAFSSEACEALARSQSDPHRALFELARRAEGWARVDAVRHLEGARDPEIGTWLIREACTGDVLDSYVALTAARVGDLAAVLSGESLDVETLDGAARLLEALTDVDGPGPALRQYADAVRALTGYLRHVTAQSLTLPRLWTLLTVHRFLQDGRVDALCATDHDWRRVRDRYARAVADPAARRVVLAGLDAEEQSTLRLAAWAATRMGLPVRPTLLRRVESHPYDTALWFLLVDGCPSEDIAAVVEAARRVLPLQDLRGGPTEPGPGTDDAIDGVLDIIVSRLDGHPGHGWELVETALHHRTSRNRRMAVRAIEDWPAAALPPEARRALLDAAAREPLAELRAELSRAAERLCGPRP
ncbi:MULTISPECIES: hypothetical protein [unclassified Streptomyces]|uniref:hypothetical protein n=1 Tax=unclassified Streptomyces TaxID=2593676 RepID=UPI0036EF4A63